MSRYLIANWKSNKNRQEAQAWLQEFARQLKGGLDAQLTEQDILVVLTPAFPLVPLVADALTQHQLQAVTVGVQSLSAYPAGSYTGSVSARNLEGLSVEYALLGHSEDRRYLHTNSHDVANQVEHCLQTGIVPIVCVDTPYLQEQAQALDSVVLPEVLVAYEPLAAIGTGDEYPVAEVAEVVTRIRTVFGKVPVLYGGSVDAGNVAGFLEIADGVLVGTDSLDVADFTAVVRAAL